METRLKPDGDWDRPTFNVFHDVTVCQLHYDVRAETRLCSYQYEESVKLLSQMAEEYLNLLALVSSMPRLRHVLEICFGQAVVAVMR